jgi:hypothetical protein
MARTPGIIGVRVPGLLGWYTGVSLSRTLWNMIEGYRTLWNILEPSSEEHHGMSWNLMEYLGTWWNILEHII